MALRMEFSLHFGGEALALGVLHRFIHSEQFFSFSARSLTIARTLSHSCGMESEAHVCAIAAAQRCEIRDRNAVRDTPVSSANFRQWPDSMELIESLPPIFIAGEDASAGQNTVETRS